MLNSIFILLFGSTGFISFFTYYLVGAIDSYYKDSDGTSFLYGDKDYLVLTLAFLGIVLFGIYAIYNSYKNRKVNKNYFVCSILYFSFIESIYNLGMMIKVFMKNGNGSLYLIYFLIFLVLLLTSFIYLLPFIKRKKSE